MKPNVKLTAAFLVCTTASLCALGGCAKSNDKMPATRTRGAVEESSFAAGAGRAPTAATSYSFAKILVSQGRDRDALYVLSQIIREHPKYLPAYNEMAGVYMRADRLDDAIAALTVGLEQSPKDGVLHNNLGMCYLLKDEPQRALEAFTRATDAVPNSATFRSNRAAALALTARDAEAESEYRTVVGTLQARQNVLALAKARDGRSELRQEQGRIDAMRNIEAADAEAPAAGAKTESAIEAPAPAPTPAAAETSTPSSSSQDQSLAPTSAVETPAATWSETPRTAAAVAPPVAPPAPQTAIHILAGAASLSTPHSTSSTETPEPTPWVSPVPDETLDNADAAPDAEELN